MTAVLLTSLLFFGADPEPGFRPPSMNGEWMLDNGYMGIELVLKGSDFEYWFYSDVVDGQEPEYPIRGKVLYRGTSIQLVPAKEEELYSKVWRLVVNDGEICMLADHDLQDHRPPKFPSGRLLFKVADEPTKMPVLTQPQKAKSSR